jgi:hypothetical protein
MLLLLLGGLGAFLGVNTAAAEASFTLHSLQQRSDDLTDQEQALTITIDRLASPGDLSRRAAELGMRPGLSAFLQLPSGRVTAVGAPPHTASR